MDFSPKESHKFEVANPNAVNYPKKLMELEAPVISIVYTSRTLFSVNDDDISERFDAVGPNCILAQGIGEVTEQVASSFPVEVPPMQWDDFRLSNIRRNLLQFDARRRHVDGEKSFDIAVSEGTEPNTAANNAARYARGSSREFTFASELAVVDEGKKFAKERCESPVKDDGLG
ncbi:Hypothetical protein, putative [Bodo saltans]|uniref:Uncharacterized protein n=1 Tax=Bodo saltans TaxID=75058 RepID=A0A0S4J7Q7_BODSA|nr:Hypothetical protein, putative [Bodo saltans]|eukprot:CUG86021.1 Hypothetical protein, putative [Bodo saltans]